MKAGVTKSPGSYDCCAAGTASPSVSSAGVSAASARSIGRRGLDLRRLRLSFDRRFGLDRGVRNLDDLELALVGCDEPRVDDLGQLGAVAVPLLAHTGLLADPLAEVVELRAVDVPDRHDLDLLDLRRMERERALHPHPERLLPDGERLADAGALPLEDDALVDLDTAARTLDHLEMDADGIAGLEARHLAQLGALDGLDDAGHKKMARRADAEW